MASSRIGLGDLIPTASLTSSSEDPEYPIENAQNDDPSDTFKALGTSATITATIASSTPIAYAFINTNATSIALTNGAGMASQVQTVPSLTPDGKLINGFKDLTGVANRTSTSFVWTVSKTGTAVLEIGRIVLVTTLHELLWMYGLIFGIRRPGSLNNVTRLGRQCLRYSPVAAIRTASGLVRLHTELSTLLTLEATGNGLGQGILLIPEIAVNDAWFVRLVDFEQHWARQGPQATEFTLALEERAMGLPPART